MKKSAIILCIFFLITRINAQSKTQIAYGVSLAYPSYLFGKRSDIALKSFSSKAFGFFGISSNIQIRKPTSKNTYLKLMTQLSYYLCNQKNYGLSWGTDWDGEEYHPSITNYNLSIGSLEFPIMYCYIKNSKLTYAIGVVPQYIFYNHGYSYTHSIDNWQSDVSLFSHGYPISKFNYSIRAEIGFKKKLNSTMLYEINPFLEINMIGDDLFFQHTGDHLCKLGVGFNFIKGTL